MMSIIQMSLPISSPSSRNQGLATFLSGIDHLNLLTHFSHLSIHRGNFPGKRSTVIRMGGGPRTYPGGVSKWQWKRMQAKKAKQLLKARLCRERQIYEMRKRAELRAAVSELEKPWEVVERAPTLFSVRADEQLKVLADRFQKPGGYDLWSERDGPQVFHTVDNLPSARFFPKGVVHSIKPYESVRDSDWLDSSEDSNQLTLPGPDVENPSKGRKGGKRFRKSSSRGSSYRTASEEGDRDLKILGEESAVIGDMKRLDSGNGRERSRDFNRRRPRTRGTTESGKNSYGSNPENARYDTEGRNEVPFGRRGRNRANSERRYHERKASSEATVSNTDVYDMSLKRDGSYEFQED